MRISHSRCCQVLGTLSRVDVTDGTGQCVGGILGRFVIHAQQHPDHVLNLPLASAAGTNYCALDLERTVLCHRQSLLHRRQQRNAPGVTQYQCSLGICCHENLLDSRALRPALVDYRLDALVNYCKPRSEITITRADTLTMHVIQTLTTGLDHAHPGDAGTRIDAEYPEGIHWLARPAVPQPAGCISSGKLALV